VAFSGDYADLSGSPDNGIAGSASGTVITLTDAADARVQRIKIKGHSEIVSGEIVSVGDNGLTVTTANGDGTLSSTATVRSGLPLRSVDENTYDELDSVTGKVITRCEIVGGAVVAKATPEVYSLAYADINDLRSLRTYQGTTTVSATDSPEMTVDYIRNTDNGKAVSRLSDEISGKVGRLVFDSDPIYNSPNLLSSGVIYDALQQKQNTLTFDNSPTSGSSNPVKSSGIYTALAGKQNTLTFDNSPTSGSSNPVKSGGVYTALAGKQNTLTFDNSPTSGSSNPVKSSGVYTALAGKQNKIGTIVYNANISIAKSSWTSVSGVWKATVNIALPYSPTTQYVEFLPRVDCAADYYSNQIYVYALSASGDTSKPTQIQFRSRNSTKPQSDPMVFRIIAFSF
jgi:hypothetical protein